MGVANPPINPANVMQALVYTLSDVFDATRDLYQTLTIKEHRDYEQNLRSKGYPTSRRVEYVKDESLGSDEAIVLDKIAVTQRFEDGYRALGEEFAMGDATSHTALQSQIIKLQGVLLATFLYGPTSAGTIAHQLSTVNAASRSAAAASVDILAELQERLQDERLPTSRSMHSMNARSGPTYAPSYEPTHSRSRARSHTVSHAPSHAPSRELALPHTTTGTSSTSTALMKYNEPRESHASRMRSSSPVNTTVLEWRGRPKPERSDTDTTSMTGPTSYGMKSASHDLYCLYAIDLQRSPTQPLSTTILSDAAPYCPHCECALHLSPGKAWEISKWDSDCERTFQVQNRFVVKCHRAGPDGQYCCVICSKYADADTVCGDVKALVKHLSDEHDIRELKHEEDIVEVIEQPVSRRDSGIGHGSSRDSRSRRSASLASGRRRRKSLPAYEREVEIFEIRPSRR
ncbi:hypothetical protein BDW02DRAFT_581755 [Decorospora gaudefroyi]|uniref:Uncharacterized protein n=1 Tax=Decorospora gaudefroyi TaxID=184978 RepID=A0A6A5K706_9PLEO|nr:hypothetical protein BDW02DRAFT_581755 [Decorospora gaudefroyi]